MGFWFKYADKNEVLSRKASSYKILIILWFLITVVIGLNTLQNSSELKTKIYSLQQKVDHLQIALNLLEGSIADNEKRKVQINKIIQAIKITSNFNNPLPGCKNRLTTGDYWQISTSVIDMSDRYDVDPALILAIIRQESMFCNDAISPAGARGYMQLMPDTATTVANNVGLPLKTWHGRDNIHLGTVYINEMLSEFKGNIDLAIKAYNTGPHNVKKVLTGMWKDYPTETKEYVVKVLKFKEQYRSMGVK